MLKTIKWLIDKDVRSTKHFQEWYKLPKDYVRIKEFKFTENNIEISDGCKVLDLSSPKWFSFVLLQNRRISLTISDVDDYFVNDFEVYSRKINNNVDIRVFDAAHSPFQDNFFDRVFSVSVLEHIPFEGDTLVINEIKRILRPNGIGIITLPAATTYFEEWLTTKHFYWNTVTNNEGKYFYQRRYDRESITNRLSCPGLVIEKIEFIAEKPMKPPYLDDNGMYRHNASFINKKKLLQLVEKLDFRLIPFTRYFVHLFFSMKHQYFTVDHKDPNIRQVCIKFRKLK